MSSTARAARLAKAFDLFCNGSQQITSYNTPQFLESIYTRPDAVASLHKLAISRAGKDALQAAMRFKCDQEFMNGQGSLILKFLRHESLPQINDGQLLRTLVLKVVDPPIFWHALHKAYLDKELTPAASENFAWLLLQLVSLPPDSSQLYRNDPDLASIQGSFLTSEHIELRTFGQKIKNILDAYKDLSTEGIFPQSAGGTPGGRHDNDFPNFREISIVPTPDEVNCKEKPFMRTRDVLDDPRQEASRTAIHLDNQFRLLREDMLYELREELTLAQSPGKKRRRSTRIDGLEATKIYIDPNPNRRTKYGIELVCNADLPFFNGITPSDRLQHLKDNRNFLKHQTLACLFLGTQIIAFVTITRDENLLATEQFPTLVVHLEGKEGTMKAFRVLKQVKGFSLLQIDTALFSYEFVLKALQTSRGIPLAKELLFWKEGDELIESSKQATQVVDALKANLQVDLQPLLATKDPIILDKSQAKSLLSGLTHRVSLIQGPPGTGKSFLGALLAKAIHLHTDLSILVVCYTNHALDDILTSLLDIGIPESHMIRLGGKSTTRTEPLSIQKQNYTGYTRDLLEWQMIDEYKAKLAVQDTQLQNTFTRYLNINPGRLEILEHIEFEDPEYFATFTVPTEEDGMRVVGNGGRAIGEDYLLSRWVAGLDAGVLKKAANVREAREIWGMARGDRQKKYQEWMEYLQREQMEELYTIGKTYNDFQDHLEKAFAARYISLLKEKRIIGCTTTAAAKYGYSLQLAAPDVVLVEEAGEILESHVLTALGKDASQLILIGDHKQLRPKVNNYELTVEKGLGFDLNMSLFERLILSNYPHQSLSKQHRMRPEISNLIRQLNYPELEDAPKTQNRPDIIGLQENVVFIDHAHPESVHEQLADHKDMASTVSKHNTFEVEMVLKIVKYLGQQGYGTQDMVVLTPYLGQLHKLRNALKEDTDPVLNDLDSFELVRAGLLTAATAKAAKKPLRLATVDNYQGEEANIVILSLTRSNSNGDIGFMYSPERLNVLLSRARNGMVMIGNSITFKASKKGKELWGKLFDMLVAKNSLHSGLPVVCARHPDRKEVLQTPQHFDEKVPDGGCPVPCGVTLICNMHQCPSKCHNLSDHSKVKCETMLALKCPRGHDLARKCYEISTPDCKACKRLDDVLLKKAQADLKEKRRREQEEAKHLEELAKIEAEIEAEKDKKKRERELQDQQNAILQKLVDLANMRAVNSFPVGSASAPAPQEEPEKKGRSFASPSTAPSFNQPRNSLPSMVANTVLTPPPKPSTATHMNVPIPNLTSNSKPSAFQKEAPSPSESEWDRQKRYDGAVNPHIDKIMGMVGLEDVKKQVLAIKAKIDTCSRQGTSLSKERFNIVFLGNPGTGKTTVAREYAAFLSYVQVLPGDKFEETSGSRLAYEGVAGAEKMLKDVLTAGGGAIFIDEAYQLTSKHNPGGAQVLDFLLTEMENNVGKLVFILAGYTKEMESFFEFNPGLNSRVPYKIKFANYTDEELMTMLENLVTSTYKGRMKVDQGLRGLFGRVAIRRLGRRRGSKGFGNARELQTFFEKVRERQAIRLGEERKCGKQADDFVFTQEDLLGPDPSIAIKQSKAWTKLQILIGLKSVKESVQNLVDSVKENYDRELTEQAPLDFSLNRVFLGPPGTGKTTVAELYGQILADIGMLSKGEVIVRNPSDFVGAVLGESEQKTKGILDNAVGKVLVIDEAYMLHGGGSGDSKNQGNQFKTSVIDTIVAEVQNVPGEDRCVLLLGYEKQMADMFQNVNPGLARRFKVEEAFRFEDFNDQELLQILEKKLKDQDLGATDSGKAVAIESLARARTRPNFGNGGEVENLLSKAKEACLSRRNKIPYDKRPRQIILEPQDFDKDFDRGSNATKNLEKLFEDIVGHGGIKSKLADYQNIALVCKTRNMNPRDQVPTNFVFTGPPGTGKTTIARKMGQVYYDMGILASKEVVECSASDLVGEYVGHTGPKTKALFEKALGKVLFVDEAYRLAEGHFAQEAIDELVGLLTHETFKGKVIVILAGYDQDMKRLMQSNTGLNSRFPEWVPFLNIPPTDCLDIVIKELKKKSVIADDLLDVQSTTYADMLLIVDQLSRLPDWGNARDMVQLSKDLINQSLLNPVNQSNAGSSNGGLVLSSKDILDCANKMLMARTTRSRVQPKHRPLQYPDLPVAHANPTPPTPPATGIAMGTKQATPPPPVPSSPKAKRQGPPRKPTASSRGGSGYQSPTLQNAATSTSIDSAGDTRDPGVSNAIWTELQQAKRAAQDRERREKAAIAQLNRELSQKASHKREAEAKAKKLAQDRSSAQDETRRAEIERQRIAAIQRAAKIAEEQERIALELKRQQQVAAERKRRDQVAQQKLRTMGVCEAGFRWISIGSGYRCAGGWHFVSNEQLGI